MKRIYKCIVKPIAAYHRVLVGFYTELLGIGSCVVTLHFPRVVHEYSLMKILLINRRTDVETTEALAWWCRLVAAIFV